jgi:hypothetical protein
MKKQTKKDKEFIAKISTLYVGGSKTTKPKESKVPHCPDCHSPMKIVAQKEFNLPSFGNVVVGIARHDHHNGPTTSPHRNN